MPRGQNLFFQIYNAVRKIPAGRVATYGQVAAMVGSPRAARIVGWALRSLPVNSHVPWQRVVNREGMISIENMDVPKEAQADILRREGVTIELREGNLYVDLKKFGWNDIV